MRAPLQPFGFQGSRYERPDDAWTCARAPEGGCPLGPTRRGRCRERPPCQPRRTLRSWRGWLCRGAVVFSVGLLLAAFAEPELRWRVILPGELSQHHAPLVEDCDACHGAAKSPTAWLQASFSSRRAEEDSQRCQMCHPFTSDPLAPHTLPPEELLPLTAKARERASGQAPPLLAAAAALSSAQGGHGDLACSTCHREHQGREHRLRELSDARCQVCHSQRFASLSDGHPELSSFGQERVGRIAFTHAAHFGAEDGHYVEKGTPVPACAACHVLDGRGRHVRLLPNTFEQSCATCHSGTDKEFKALPLLRVPAAPVAWLGTVGAWPLAVERDEDLDADATDPTPLMRALLDPAAEEGPKALRGLVEVFTEYAIDFIEEAAEGDDDDDAWDGTVTPEMREDYYGDEDEAAAAAAREETLFGPARAYLADVKRLLAELHDPEGTAFAARLARIAGREVDPAACARLPGSAPGEWLGRVRAAWLVADEPADAPSRVRPPEELEAETHAVPGAGTWRASEALRLSYADYPHRDPFLTSLLDLAEQLPPGSPRLEQLERALRGRCTKCHRVERRAAPNRVRVHWRAAFADPRERAASFFAHAPHLRLESSQDCEDCHTLRDGEETADTSDFVLQAFSTRAECAACHTAERAGEGCLDCHNYHVGRLPEARAADMGTWTGSE